MNTTTLERLYLQLAAYENAETLLLAAVKASAVLLLGLSLTHLLQHRSAAARSAVWRLCLSALFLMAVWQLCPPHLRPVEIQWLPSTALPELPVQPVLHSSTLPLDFAPQPPFSRLALRAVDAHGMTAWLSIAALLVAWRIGRAILGRWWLQRHSEPAPALVAGLCEALCRELKPSRRPQCRLAQRIGSPVLTGQYRAIIWLPMEAASWEESRLRAVLQHELAHHRRHDVLWQWLAVAAACGWWWNPLSWLALVKYRQEIEHAADDLAVLRDGNTKSYARALVEIAAGIANPKPTMVGVAMFGKGPVHDRVRALLKINRWRGRIGAGVIFLLSLVGLIALVLVTLNVRHYALPSRYLSTAKLVAEVKAETNGGGPKYREYLVDFYGTIIETLESSEMNRRAVDRVRALDPDLKEVDVEIVVTQAKGSAVFNVMALASEPKYTRAFLNALLDEFRSFRDSIREQQRNKALTALAEDVVKREQQVKEKAERVSKLAVKPELAEAEASRLVAQLTALRQRRDAAWQLKKGIKPTTPVEQGLETVDIEALDQELLRLVKIAGEAVARSDEAKQAVRDYEGSNKAWRDMLELVGKFQVNDDMTGDAVAIMERATPAVPEPGPWWVLRIKGDVVTSK